jgi:hypothetical protein
MLNLPAAIAAGKFSIPASVRHAVELVACMRGTSAAGWLGSSGDTAVESVRSALAARFPAADGLAPA